MKITPFKIVVAAILALLALVAAVRATTWFVSRMEYRAPERASAPELTPRDQGKSDEHEAQVGQVYGVPFCPICGRHHQREEDHRF